MSTVKKLPDDFIAQEEYLELERNSEKKHEYVDSRIVAMSGASVNHNRIAGNIYSSLHTHFKGQSCESFMNDMKVLTSAGNYRYPDVMVVCDDEFINDGYATKTPVILVEVLSRSTRKVDEQEKRLEYMNIPSLEEYVLIEQDVVDIEVVRKCNNWQSDRYYLGDTVIFRSINLAISVEDIYDRVKNDDVTDWIERESTKN
jgi:Uma2 family endonuclease